MYKPTIHMIDVYYVMIELKREHWQYNSQGFTV